MTNRPCKPEADLQGIWQMFLPDVPLPACGVRDTEFVSQSKGTTMGDRQLNRHDEQAHRGSAGAAPDVLK